MISGLFHDLHLLPGGTWSGIAGLELLVGILRHERTDDRPHNLVDIAQDIEIPIDEDKRCSVSTSITTLPSHTIRLPPPPAAIY